MKTNLNTKLLLVIILIGFIGCKETKQDKSYPIIVNKVLNSEYSINFNKQNLDSIYPKLLNPKTFDFEKDSVTVDKIRTYQNAITDIFSSDKIKWNNTDSTINILTRVYFDNSGNIEYFTFKVTNENIPLTAIKKVNELLENNLKKISTGVKHNTKYQICSNYKIKNVN